MGIDLRSANSSAAELSGYAEKLRAVKNSISTYRSTLSSNWEGREVDYYINAVLSIERRLKNAADELDSIGKEVTSTADEIWREEEAERKRREEEERRRQEEEERERQEAEERAAAAAKKVIKGIINIGGGGGSW